MKLAYFAPLPPKRTGVADYASHLATALSRHAEIDFFDSAPSLPPIPGADLIDYVARPDSLLALPDYDAVLYQLGNNPEFHAHIFQAFLAWPGPVILHDSVLYFLMAGLNPGGMLREFLYNYGPERLDEFFAIEHECLDRSVLRYPYPERYPFLKRVLAVAPQIIVHSATSAETIRNLGYGGTIEVIPHLVFPTALERIEPAVRTAARQTIGVADDELLLGNFGFIGRTKRFPVILAALAGLKRELSFKFLIVGEGPDLANDIEAAGLADRVVRTGFVDDARYRVLLGATDILINLRFPSMGETSGPQIQAMAGGVATIVSDQGWFAELPDSTVRKVCINEAEKEMLAEAIHALADTTRRAELADAARAYVRAECAPEIVAARFAKALSGRPRRSEGFYPGSAEANAA